MYKLIDTHGSIAEGGCLLQPHYQYKCEALKYSYLLMDKPPAAAAEPEGSEDRVDTTNAPYHQDVLDHGQTSRRQLKQMTNACRRIALLHHTGCNPLATGGCVESCFGGFREVGGERHQCIGLVKPHLLIIV